MQKHRLDGVDGIYGGRKYLDGKMESDHGRGMLSGPTLAHVVRKMDEVDGMRKTDVEMMEDLC